MALVELLIGGRNYKIACEAGDEKNLLELAQYVDDKTRELTGAIGHISEPLLLVMTCLQITDEYRNALQKIETLKATPIPAPIPEVQAPQNSFDENLLKELDTNLAAKINKLAEKIYSIAQSQ